MSRFSSSQIMWALDVKTDKLVKADRAERKPGKGRYRCLDEKCGHDLTVARSKHGRQHFKHFRTGNAEGCAFHSPGNHPTQHSAAQVLLHVMLSEALKRRIPMPLFQFNTPSGIRTVLPFITASNVIMEWQCPQTDRRADLAILDEKNQPVLLVEVFHTHAVDLHKRQDFSSYWWIEVEAKQVLADPGQLNIRNHGNLPGNLALVWQQFELYGA